MKFLKILFSVIIVFTSYTINAQEKSNKQLERQNNKVDTLYTVEERANMQMLLYNEVDKMDLTDEDRAEYYRILLSHTYDMARLDDKDKDYTEDERKTMFKNIILSLNTQLKDILSPEQFRIHEKSFGEITRSVYNKSNWIKE